MSPITVQDWLEIANQRATDAQAIHQHQLSSVGAVYMAGYAIECSLKALLQDQGIEYPKKGRQGHDLKNLWRSSPFQFSDLQDDQGTQTFFLEQWNTDLRYESSLPVSLGLEVKELMEGAKKLQGWIQTQIRRGKFRKRR